MPASGDAALALSDQLRSRSDHDLAALLRAREVGAAGIRDFFDLADALLAADSVRAALARLPRQALIATGLVAQLGAATRADAAAHASSRGATWSEPAADRAVELALMLDRDGVLSTPRQVAAELAEWPRRGGPDLDELIGRAAPPVLTPVGGDLTAVDRAGAERAFSTTAAVAEVVAELHREPARELARGGIALPDARRLAAVASVPLDRVPQLLGIADRAGLAASQGDRVATDAGLAWLPRPSAERWGVLAGAWLDSLPDDVRSILRDRAGAQWGDRLGDYLAWLYPGDGEWIARRVAETVRDAEALGITTESQPGSAGSRLVTEGVDAAVAAIGFPPEVDRVYVQRDLSVIAPGPLAPAVAARLRTIAEPEGSVAGSYRITTESLNGALANGDTAESITAFLTTVSLSGIPQPLQYLISEASARLGLVRVRAEGSGSVVRSADATLLRTIAVDQSLAPLALTDDGDVLRSRFDRDLVFWSLAAARYPVAAEDAEGRMLRSERPRRPAPASPARQDAVLALIERLRSANPGDRDATDRAWLTRQLDVAIRTKAALAVTVTLQDGSSVRYELEPASVAGGRLRARDRRTDLERTLPLSRITAVEPAGS
jgi:hypothetical protein